MVITIDGPAGSGKSTAAKMLAEKTGAAFLDTGAMYRAATLAAMRSSCDLADAGQLQKVLDETHLRFDIRSGQMLVFINDADCTEQIRLPEVTANVHFIASVPTLREKLVQMQRDFADKHEKIVTEGRDQGTVAFADADIKFFLVAHPAERAKRRAAELEQKGWQVDIEQLQQEIEQRDASDQARQVGPLVRAEDAIEVDSTELTVGEVVEMLLGHVEKKCSKGR